MEKLTDFADAEWTNAKSRSMTVSAGIASGARCPNQTIEDPCHQWEGEGPPEPYSMNMELET
jgi:hypothetical protein